MKLRNRLIAISAVLAMAMSFAGCSDDGKSSEAAAQEGVVATAESLTPEEYDEITKHELTIEPFNPGSGDVQQDNVEGGDAAEGNGDNANDDGGAAADNSTAGNSGTGSQVADNDPGSNNADLSGDTGLEVHNGTRTVMQAWWMDISKAKDYVFNGEYLTAEFKIKEDAPDGIYPVTIDWLDFANWNSTTVEFTGIDGAVVVGGEAAENTFNDDDKPQIMVSNVSGKAGETVTVTFNVKNNPGVVANILRFGYNSDVLEYVGGGEGADFDGNFS